MTRLALIVIAVFALNTVSCKKTEQRQDPSCAYNYWYEPARIGFTGFELSDLDTILVAKYAANSSFGKLLKEDTILAPSIDLHHDTAFLSAPYSYYPYGIELDTGADYKVEVMATGRTRSVSQIGFKQRPGYYTSPDGCGGGRVFRIYPDSAYIDGAMIYSNYGSSDVLFFIQK